MNRIKLAIMTVVFTLGQAFAFWVVLPLWGGAYELDKVYKNHFESEAE